VVASWFVDGLGFKFSIIVSDLEWQIVGCGAFCSLWNVVQDC